jgi:hypothetical protein
MLVSVDLRALKRRLGARTSGASLRTQPKAKPAF